MSGYIELNRTGFAPFDDALSLIEEAGDAYHHTSQWIEDGWTGEKPYLVQINESIEFAAKSYLSLQDENNELRTQLAASQLHAEQLREALVTLNKVSDIGCGRVEKALALPRDTSAIDAYVAEKVKEHDSRHVPEAIK